MPSAPRPDVLEEAFSNIRPALLAGTPRNCSIVIDTEEDFDWDRPVQGIAQSTRHIRTLPILAALLRPYGAVPTYLLTYPVLEDPDAVAIIRHQLEAGTCAVGLQLHPWVTPPFGSDFSPRASFIGNLTANEEEQKLLSLKARFVACFGFAPQIYRAGRYGLSASTPRLLEKHGFTIDTSIAPRTSFTSDGGPDYTDHDNRMFWFGSQATLLEVPLCRSLVGWGGRIAPVLYGRLAEGHPSLMPLQGLMARSRFAERLTLSPEGNDFHDMRRLIRDLMAHGQSILPLSFHSSSLQVGQNPYVRTKADLHFFYDRLSEVLDHMARDLAFSFAALEQVPALLLPPA